MKEVINEFFTSIYNITYFGQNYVKQSLFYFDFLFSELKLKGLFTPGS